jgi:hypothetical protein
MISRLLLRLCDPSSVGVTLRQSDIQIFKYREKSQTLFISYTQLAARPRSSPRQANSKKRSLVHQLLKKNTRPPWCVISPVVLTHTLADSLQDPRYRSPQPLPRGRSQET